jgi:hypothetical protein
LQQSMIGEVGRFIFVSLEAILRENVVKNLQEFFLLIITCFIAYLTNSLSSYHD